MGLLADVAKWMRSLDDWFSSYFDFSAEILAVTLALCEHPNSFRIWNKSRQKFFGRLP